MCLYNMFRLSKGECNMTEHLSTGNAHETAWLPVAQPPRQVLLQRPSHLQPCLREAQCDARVQHERPRPLQREAVPTTVVRTVLRRKQT